VKLGHRSPTNLTDWYLRSYKDLLQIGGSGLLRRYNNSLYRLLTSVYPSFDWQPWRFKKLPNKLLNMHELEGKLLLSKLVEFLEKELGIEKLTLEDLERISIKRLEELGLAKVLRNKAVEEALRNRLRSS